MLVMRFSWAKGWRWSWQAQPNQNSSVSPALWISASARIMAMSVDRGDLHRGNIKDYMAKVGASRYTWASILLYDQEHWWRTSGGVGIPNTCPPSYWSKSQQHLAKLHFQSNTPLLADDWDLGAEKSVSGSTQGNAHTVESVTSNTCAQCAYRPTPSVTTACPLI